MDEDRDRYRNLKRHKKKRKPKHDVIDLTVSDDSGDDEADDDSEVKDAHEGHVFKASFEQMSKQSMVAHLEVFAKLKLAKDSQQLQPLRDIYFRLLKSDAAELRKVFKMIFSAIITHHELHQ